MGCRLVSSSPAPCINSMLTTEAGTAAMAEILNRTNRAAEGWEGRQTMDITITTITIRHSSNTCRVKLHTISILITLGLGLPGRLVDRERTSAKTRSHSHRIDSSISKETYTLAFLSRKGWPKLAVALAQLVPQTPLPPGGYLRLLSECGRIKNTHSHTHQSPSQKDAMEVSSNKNAKLPFLPWPMFLSFFFFDVLSLL